MYGLKVVAINTIKMFFPNQIAIKIFALLKISLRKSGVFFKDIPSNK